MTSDRVNDGPPPGYRTQSEDTEYWAEKLLFDHWRAMGPREKLESMASLSKSLRELQLAGLRAAYPHATAHDLQRMAARLRLGEELWAWVEAKQAAESERNGR